MSFGDIARRSTDMTIGARSSSMSTGAFSARRTVSADAIVEQVFGQVGQNRISTTVDKRRCLVEQLFLCSASLGWKDGEFHVTSRVFGS